MSIDWQINRFCVTPRRASGSVEGAVMVRFALCVTLKSNLLKGGWLVNYFQIEQLKIKDRLKDGRRSQLCLDV
jgi:hypothetical protein